MARNMDNGRTRRSNRWSLAIWGTAACLLLLPAIAMRFPGSGVDWDARDFIIMGVMFAIACGTYELATRLSDSVAYRAAAGIAIVTGFLTVWVNLAAGMLGSERNPDNLLFAGVLAIALLGAAFARLQAGGLARAMCVAALAQALLAGIALVAGWDDRGAVFSAAFAVPWLLSAALFALAARAPGRDGATP